MTIEIREATSAADRAAAWSIRAAVFIREQGIDESLERDGHDETAWHFVAWDGSVPVGTARVLGLDPSGRVVAPDGAATAKIGRMAVLPERRRAGIGRLLLDAALRRAAAGGLRAAVLSAQAYVVPFYEAAGFTVEGEPYDEAGIPHRAMRRELA